MKCKHCLVILTVFILCFAFYAYERLPDNAEQPMVQHLSYIMKKIFLDICRFVSFIGCTSTYNCTRAIINLKKGELSDANLEVFDVSFDGINVRLYKPRDASANHRLPGIIFIHGGGWVLMTKEFYDDLTRELSRDVNAVVVSLEYRKAPENIYPAAFDDCVKAAKYFMENAKSFDVDPKRIAITGDSAGGNLAMAVSLKLSEIKQVPTIKAQVLIYPALQMVDFNTPSFTSYQQGPFGMVKHSMVEYWLYYAFGSIDNIEAFKQNNHTTQELRSVMDRSLLPEKYRRLSVALPEHTDKHLHTKVKPLLTDKYLAPLMCSDDDLKKLPKTYILTCEYDPLRDEGIILVGRMRKLKIPVTHQHWEGVSHGFMDDVGLLHRRKEAMVNLINFMKKEL